MEHEEHLKLRDKSKHTIWILAILLIALTVRLIGLASMSFTEVDSTLAADALAISRNESLGSSALPAYTGLTSVLFYVLGSGNIIARLVPLIAGVSLVLAAFVFAKQKSFKFGVILALAMSLDWFMVSMSRQLNTPLIALAGLVWAYYFFNKRNFLLSGVLFGIAFLGGYYFWVFVLGILGFWLINRIIKVENRLIFNKVLLDKKEWLQFFIAFLVTVLLVSTGFLLQPSGIGQIGVGLETFVGLIVKAYQLPVYHVFYVIIKFAILALLGAIAYLLSKENTNSNNIKKGLICVLLYGLFATIGFARQDMGVAVLIIVPLWIMCAEWLSQIKLSISERPALKIAAFFTTVVLMVYVGMMALQLFSSNLGRTILIQTGIATAAGILLILVLIWLSSLAFEVKNALLIFTVALVLVLTVGSFAQTFNALTKTEQETQLTLSYGPIVLGNRHQLDSLSIFDSYGRYNKVEANVHYDDINQDLRWHFKDYLVNKEVSSPEIVLSKTENLARYPEPYRGTRIELSRVLPWNQMRFETYLKSMILPINQWQVEGAFLWAQTKLFSGATQ